MEIKEILDQEQDFRSRLWGQLVQRASPACTNCHSTGCCQQLVIACSMESILLLGGVTPTIISKWDALCQQAEREKEAVESGLAEAFGKGERVMSRHAATRYFQNRNLCAFHDGQCLVYSLRPWACVFLAVPPGTPPAHCEPEYLGNIPTLNCWAVHKRILDTYRVNARLIGLSFFPALDCGKYGKYPLPLAMSLLFHAFQWGVTPASATDASSPAAQFQLLEKAKEARPSWLSRVVEMTRR
jgi:hypothetical protein